MATATVRDVPSTHKFIVSLSKSLQALCQGCMDFDTGIEIMGYIAVNIDSGSTKVDYVLNELVKRRDDNSMHFESNSFLAKKDQLAYSHGQDEHCLSDLELHEESFALSRSSSSLDIDSFIPQSSTSSFQVVRIPDERKMSWSKKKKNVQSSRANQTKVAFSSGNVTSSQPKHTPLSIQSTTCSLFNQSDVPSTNVIISRSLKMDIEHQGDTKYCNQAEQFNTEIHQSCIKTEIDYEPEIRESHNDQNYWGSIHNSTYIQSLKEDNSEHPINISFTVPGNTNANMTEKLPLLDKSKELFEGFPSFTIENAEASSSSQDDQSDDNFNPVHVTDIKEEDEYLQTLYGDSQTRLRRRRSLSPSTITGAVRCKLWREQLTEERKVEEIEKWKIRNKRWRDNLKADPVRHEAHKKRQRDYSQTQRNKNPNPKVVKVSSIKSAKPTSDKDETKKREDARLRQQRRREKIKANVELQRIQKEKDKAKRERSKVIEKERLKAKECESIVNQVVLNDMKKESELIFLDNPYAAETSH